MKKTIVITGATDGIGLETAKKLAAQGHFLVIHGRNKEKLADVRKTLLNINPNGEVSELRADLSDLNAVLKLAKDILDRYTSIDVLINNAGVFKTPYPVNADGYDTRFVVNTLAPYVLTNALLVGMNKGSRVINLSSAAQAPVSLDALKGNQILSDSAAYAQSKLAITMWSAHLAQTLREQGPAIIAVNPASFLGSKMVKEAYGSEGKDLAIGADVLVRAALSDEFSDANGKYFDNDVGKFTEPHPHALDSDKNAALVATIEALLTKLGIES